MAPGKGPNTMTIALPLKEKGERGVNRETEGEAVPMKEGININIGVPHT